MAEVKGTKRKPEEEEEEEQAEETNDVEQEASEDDEDDESSEQDTVDVDFEFFDPKPIDFHGLKSLLRQTFTDEAEEISLSELADLIIAQPAVGSTVKCDDGQDPYALVTVVNLEEHKDKKCVKGIKDYLTSKTRKGGQAQAASSGAEQIVGALNKTTGLILNERLINMPPQIVPPLFKMLLEEMEWAIEDGEPFKFDQYIYISKIYREIDSTLVEEDGVVVDTAQKGKSKKAKLAPSSPEIFYFQPEDELLQQHATFSFDYKFTKETQSSDSRRAFQDVGVDPLRRVLLIPHSSLKDVLATFEKALSA
ncbi:p21-C-terminal region-binding protein-domain-containing protein [Phlyctochytrium arcticum]|nr:p21-C-terminal region-binding protein-domain-containing protein [Phlyctochytrium arcticum]